MFTYVKTVAYLQMISPENIGISLKLLGKYIPVKENIR